MNFPNPSLIQIDYRVKRSQLISGGTYDAPAGVAGGYPLARVYRDHAPISDGPQDANIPVEVPKNSRIVITVSDGDGRADIRLAPVRLLAGWWNRSLLTVEEMNSDRKPIDEPQFDVQHSEFCTLGYESEASAWEVDNNATFNRYMYGVMIGKRSRTIPNGEIGPYMTFNAQSYEGLLWYGLEFSAVEGGTDLGHYWFDPYIRVV